MTVESATRADGRAARRTLDPAYAVSAVLLVSLCLLMAVSLLAGRVWLSPTDVINGLFSSRSQLSSLIVTELRLPRTVLAVLVGATLGLSGAVLQGLTRNPLAEPGLLGVTSGASFGAVIAIYFDLSQISSA